MVSTMIRLDKYLADSGYGTRSEVRSFLRIGEVTVNGEVVKDGARKIDPKCDIVARGGKAVEFSEFEYYMLHKPAGIITASRDKKEKTVIDLIDSKKRRDLFPVGRLDINSEGLLILTNDGQFSNMLTHPSKEIEKEYYVWVRGQKLDKSIDRLSLPMMIDNYRIKPAKVRVIEQDEKGAQLSIIIHEGRNRQIRKMCENCGLYVTRLKRIREGSLTLGRLATGQWRYLSPKEIEKLCREAGSPSSK